MKCLFVYKTASLDITDPMGIMCLIASVRQRGHEADLLLTNLEKDLYRAVRDYRPDVIGFSVTSGSEGYYLELIRRLRRHVPFLSVLGGPHPTFFPEIIEQPEVDVICRGEGDDALVELLDALAQGADYSGIRNLWVKRDGAVARNPMRPQGNAATGESVGGSAAARSHGRTPILRPARTGWRSRRRPPETQRKNRRASCTGASHGAAA